MTQKCLRPATNLKNVIMPKDFSRLFQSSASVAQPSVTEFLFSIVNESYISQNPSLCKYAVSMSNLLTLGSPFTILWVASERPAKKDEQEVLC